MLSTGAFNALLKTLEEPPEHVKFILATTEPQKLPATILSRCQRFDFKRISNEDIIKRLKIVCKESNIEISENALNIIAVLSEGAMRDALSILERCIQDGDNKIDEDKIKDLVGIPKTTFIHGLVEAVIEYDVNKALEIMQKVLEDGKDITNFIWEIIKYSKDILVYKATDKLDLYNEKELEDIKILSEKVSKEKLVSLVYELSELENDIKWSTQKTIMFQAGIIKLCNEQNYVTDDIQERLNRIEKYLKKNSENRNSQIYNVTNINNNDMNYLNKNIAENNISKNNMSKEQASSEQTKTMKNPKNESKTYSNKAEEFWPQILKELKDNGKIVLYTNLINSKAKELNDMTVAIEFPNGLNSFGKAVIEKQENVREISNMVSMACGKHMNIKYLINNATQKHQITSDETIRDLANKSDIPFTMN